MRVKENLLYLNFLTRRRCGFANHESGEKSFVKRCGLVNPLLFPMDFNSSSKIPTPAVP